MTQDTKHLLILSSWYPTRKAPFVGNFVQRQAQILSTQYTVSVLHTMAEKDLKKTEVVETSKGSFREIIVYHPQGKNTLQKYLYQKKAFEKGMRTVKDVDLIHGHVLLPRGLQFIQAKRKYKCPLLITEHGSYFRPEAKQKRNWLDKFILKKIEKYIGLLTTVSKFSANDVALDFPNLPIAILPNPIDTSLFIPAPRRPSARKEFLHVSTLDEQLKNPKGIIDACSLLVAEKKSNFHLTIISEENSDLWQGYGREKKLDQYISFVGALSSDELVPFYQRADAFLLFSKYETFSIVLAEAWACGIPTLTTSVGIGDHLPSFLGIQVEKEKTESLAAAMRCILEEKHQFDENAIRNHSLQFSKEAYLRTYASLVNPL